MHIVCCSDFSLLYNQILLTSKRFAMNLIEQLSEIVSAEQILNDEESLLHFGTDRSRYKQPDPVAVVFPRSTDEVQALVLLANKIGFALVPSGGRTGLSGGAIAYQQEVVVSFERMNKVLEVNATNRSVRCQAGVITQQLQQVASDHNLLYPVDFASSGSSHIAGNIATNAGGIRVIAYGNTRNWVSGLEVVTGDGKVMRLNQGLAKNATGYDLRHLFIGSEGTLGFITEATMQLAEAPTDLTVLVLAVVDVSALMKVFDAFRLSCQLTAFECFSQRTVDIVCQHMQLEKPLPVDAALYVLIEFDNDSEQKAKAALETFEHCLEQGYVSDGVMSQNTQQAKNLWRYREDISESINSYSPYKNDISVRIADIPAFVISLDTLIAERYTDFESVWYGHIGDGNLHLNILKPDHMEADAFFAACSELNPHVFALVHQLQGSVSAEHGVGIVKRNYLHYSRSEDEISAMRAIKAVFDPKGVMNPGKIFS